MLLYQTRAPLLVLTLILTTSCANSPDIAKIVKENPQPPRTTEPIPRLDRSVSLEAHLTCQHNQGGQFVEAACSALATDADRRYQFIVTINTCEKCEVKGFETVLGVLAVKNPEAKTPVVIEQLLVTQIQEGHTHHAPKNSWFEHKAGDPPVHFQVLVEAKQAIVDPLTYANLESPRSLSIEGFKGVGTFEPLEQGGGTGIALDGIVNGVGFDLEVP